jgi:hypothetical protein
MDILQFYPRQKVSAWTILNRAIVQHAALIFFVSLLLALLVSLKGNAGEVCSMEDRVVYVNSKYHFQFMYSRTFTVDSRQRDETLKLIEPRGTISFAIEDAGDMDLDGYIKLHTVPTIPSSREHRRFANVEGELVKYQAVPGIGGRTAGESFYFESQGNRYMFFAGYFAGTIDEEWSEFDCLLNSFKFLNQAGWKLVRRRQDHPENKTGTGFPPVLVSCVTWMLLMTDLTFPIGVRNANPFLPRYKAIAEELIKKLAREENKV